MNDLFKKRMDQIGVSGNHFVDQSNLIVKKTFQNDQNYQCGVLYDWDLNPLDESVEFKFEKHKTYLAEGNEVEYYIHFLPDYNPEFLFKNDYYRPDGKERLGFYIEVFDRTKGEKDLWLIVGKDDRVAMDRYLAYKCNWQLEWIDNSQCWHSITAVVRENIADNIREWETTTAMQGTNIGGKISVIFPTAQHAKTLTFGMRVMITDNELIPRCFEVSDMKDASPLGVTKLYLSRSKYNAHTDYCGVLNNSYLSKLKAVNNIESLPAKLGGDFHCLCDCLDSAGVIESTNPKFKKPTLHCEIDQLIVNGSSALVQTIPSESNVKWHYFVDNIEYTKEELSDYFTIIDKGSGELEVAAINRVMAQYVLKIAIYDEKHSYYSSHELEVKM